ncbi:hypothetical protein B0H19DRAFT_1075556 [Mycena capillaripes]|nr:hypothetical protein B0H19DRAFT_1075556 [Mycena capillaripes]
MNQEQVEPVEVSSTGDSGRSSLRYLVLEIDSKPCLFGQTTNREKRRYHTDETAAGGCAAFITVHAPDPHSRFRLGPIFRRVDVRRSKLSSGDAGSPSSQAQIQVPSLAFMSWPGLSVYDYDIPGTVRDLDMIEIQLSTVARWIFRPTQSPIIFTVANGVNGGNATYLSYPAATGSDGLKQFSQADTQPLLNALFFQVNCTSATTGLSLMRNSPGVRSNFGSLQASIEVMTGLEREVDDEKYLKMECSDLRWSICEAGESDVSDEEQDPAKPKLRGYFLLQKGNCTRPGCGYSTDPPNALTVSFFLVHHHIREVFWTGLFWADLSVRCTALLEYHHPDVGSRLPWTVVHACVTAGRWEAIHIVPVNLGDLRSVSRDMYSVVWTGTICIIQSEKVTVRWLKYLAYGSTDEKVSGRLQDAIVDAGKASSRDKVQAQLYCVAVDTRSDDLISQKSE